MLSGIDLRVVLADHVSFPGDLDISAKKPISEENLEHRNGLKLWIVHAHFKLGI